MIWLPTLCDISQESVGDVIPENYIILACIIYDFTEDTHEILTSEQWLYIPELIENKLMQ